MNTLSAKNLTKIYKIKKQSKGLKGFFRPEYVHNKAIDDMSFEIPKGDAVGLIGPNGAGKSTLIKIFSGILIPEKGYMTINGIIPWKERIKHTKNIGLVRGQASLLFWELPIIESDKLFKDIYQMSDESFKKNLTKLSDILEIQDFLLIPPRKLSLGQRMKCELVASFLHMPDFLFLDEPTIGLDIATKFKLLNHLKDLHKELKKTIIIATHHLSEVEFLCKNVLIIQKGQVVCHCPLEQITKKKKVKKIQFSIKKIHQENLFKDILEKSEFENNNGIYSFEVSDDKMSTFLRSLTQSIDSHNLTIKNSKIEESVMEYLS